MCVPLLDVGEGCRCGASSVHPPNADGAGGEHHRRGCVATEAREELLLTLWVRVTRRRSGAVAVREAASRQRVRRVACAGQVRYVEAEVLDLVRAVDVNLVQMPLRLEPRDRFVVCPQIEIRPASRRPGRPTAEQVMSEHPQGVDHRQQCSG